MDNTTLPSEQNEPAVVKFNRPTIDGSQRLHNIRTKVRLISERTWRSEGFGVCTGDLEREFIVRELSRLAGVPVDTRRSTPRTITELFSALIGAP